ncbi:hypothetical protein ABC345_05450 [Shouchella sp. 1P09AA]|uniref:hypothetical protein n=1 Tax=unclassified Shouchella TaxID=2893065 RepID=UPI00399F4B25
MSNKKTLLFSLGTLAVSCILFITVGSFVTATQDAQPAFTGEYDVNDSEEVLVVVKEQEHESLLLLANEEEDTTLFESDENTQITSPVFMEEHTAAFIQTTGYKDGDDPYETSSELAYSTIYFIDLLTNEVVNVADARGVLQDLAYVPSSKQLIATGENITQQSEPQEQEGNQTAIYHVHNGDFQEIYQGSYAAPGSMQATEDGKLMMILPDDQGNWTAESMFESTERIYMADPTEQQLDLELVSNPEKTEPITSFVQVEDGLIYQTILNYHDADDMYDYDLVPYSYENEEEGDRIGVSGNEIESLRLSSANMLYYVKRSSAYRNGNAFSLHKRDLKDDDHVEGDVFPHNDE